MSTKDTITFSNLLNSIFNTAEFKKYSYQCREDVVDLLEDLKFETLLDLDCGTGLLLEQIYDRLPEVKATGFDYGLERLEVAKERFKDKDINLDFGQAINLPYKDNSFDIVVSTTTFHHYQQPKKVLNEVYRVLKPGGTFIIGDTYMSSVLKYLNRISKPINEVTEMKLYSTEDIWKLLNSAGFTGIQWRLLNKFAYLIKATALPFSLETIEEI